MKGISWLHVTILIMCNASRFKAGHSNQANPEQPIRKYFELDPRKNERKLATLSCFEYWSAIEFAYIYVDAYSKAATGDIV